MVGQHTSSQCTRAISKLSWSMVQFKCFHNTNSLADTCPDTSALAYLSSRCSSSNGRRRRGHRRTLPRCLRVVRLVRSEHAHCPLFAIIAVFHVQGQLWSPRQRPRSASSVPRPVTSTFAALAPQRGSPVKLLLALATATTSATTTTRTGPPGPSLRPTRRPATAVSSTLDKPTNAPTSKPTSAPSDDEDSEDCDDSTPECEEYDVPAAGDNCYKVSERHDLTLDQFHQLIANFIEVSFASVFYF